MSYPHWFYSQKYIYFVLGVHSPDAFNYEDLLENDSDANLEHAFRVAFDKLGISRLLDAEGEPQHLSNYIIIYILSERFNFHHLRTQKGFFI